MIKKLRTFILIFIPLAFLVIGFSFDRTKYSGDPESAYLLNGLNISMLKSVGHFDHPGTTVQLYSAVVISVTHFLRFSGSDLQTDVLLHSEYYIEILRHGLIVLNSLVLLLLGFAAFSLLGNIWLALLLQIAPFLSVTLIEELFTKVSPEPFLFAAVALLTILLLKYYVSEDRNHKSYTILFALLSGFGLATKMTFLPFVIIPIIFLEGWKRKIRYSLLIIPFFILFTLPAVKGYPYMAKWFLNLGTHTGTYGQGSTGFIDPAQYLLSIRQIMFNNKELIAQIFLVILVLLLVGVKRKRIPVKNSGPGFLILLSLLVAQLLSILLVAKHYHNNHYLLPALSIMGLSLVFMYLIINRNIPESSRKYLKFGLVFLFFVVSGVSLLHKSDLVQAYKGYRISNLETNEIMARLDRDYNGFVKTYYYPTSFNVYSSLRWGNIYSRQFHTDRLMQLFPKGLFYNVRDKSFQFWETSISPGEFLAKYGGKILLIGGPKTEEEMKQVEDGGLVLKKLYEGRLQMIYEVDTALSPLFHAKKHTEKAIWNLKNDFETISPDKQWIMTGSEQFCKNASLTTDNPRSGQNSFSLPWADSYGLNYELHNVKPGQEFEISIWRYGSDDAFLVVAAKNKDSFYVQSNTFLEQDAKGWKKISLSIKVPAGFAGDNLNIYLWNHGNKPAWFDDFEISQYK